MKNLDQFDLSQQLKINSNKSKNKLKHSLSIRLSKNNSYMEPKSPRKFIVKKKQENKSYIVKAFDMIQMGCQDPLTGKLKIDGQYGDYRMKMFRKKDKMKYQNDPNSIFNDKQFSQKIWQYAYSGSKKVQIPVFEQKNSVQQNLSPMLKKQGKSKLALRRQNSILSPILKQAELNRTDTNKVFTSQVNGQLNNKINDILSKSRDFYLYKKIQNQEEEQEKNKLKKGIQQQLRQKEGHLFYRSIPQYMAEKWFKTVDNSTLQGNKVTPYVQQKIVPRSPKKFGHKRTHLFRFLQQSYQFNVNKAEKSKSMIVI